MIRATDIHSVTDFTRNAKSFIQQVKETKRPLALTVNGTAEVVVQDAATYQAMIDDLERADLINAIMAGEADIRAGRTVDAEEFFAEMDARYGLSD